MRTDCEGWTLFERRQNASVNFYRGWQAYKNGFGDLNGNFWLGLDKIHRLAKSGQNVLRIDLMDFDNDTAHAKYGRFSVASEFDNYALNIANHSGMKSMTKLGFNNEEVDYSKFSQISRWYLLICILYSTIKKLNRISPSIK
jgi:hypothetical protein